MCLSLKEKTPKPTDSTTAIENDDSFSVSFYPQVMLIYYKSDILKWNGNFRAIMGILTLWTFLP